jgi:predicted  nucleic acid-binding Zn-ribbon protein
MTKWTLPEGRKPLTDADMADLTRRLADTAIEQSELYQAAKRDAEEAEAYAEELEAKLKTAEGIGRAFEEDAGQLREKLAKAVETLRNVVEEYDLFRKDEYERGLSPLDDEIHDARTTLAELKGEDRG